MPVTTIDPRVALIVVDLQAGSAAGPSVHPFEAVVANAATLADTFRARNLPVVIVNADGVAPGRTEHPIELDQLPEGWSEVVAELAPQPGDLTITKQAWDAFHDTGLADELRRLEVTHVVVTGHATSFGVESTARSAYAHGFHVTLPVDAMTDFHPGAHDIAVQAIFPMLGETGTTEDVLAALPSHGRRSDATPSRN